MDDSTAQALERLCAANLRPIEGWTMDGPSVVGPIFDPPLTTAEQATFADLSLMAKFAIGDDLTLTEFQAIKPQLAEIRTFRTRTLTQWQGLTATQRESDEIAYLNDLTDVIRALLRS